LNKRTQSLEEAMEQKICHSTDAVFLPSDFLALADRRQIQRVLQQLIRKNVILRIGHGVYARAKISTLTNRLVPEQNLRSLAVSFLTKSGVKILPSQYERDYNIDQSNQVPTGLVIGVDRRVFRKIGFDGRYVKFEKVSIPDES